MMLAEGRCTFEIVDRRVCAFWTSVLSPFSKADLALVMAAHRKRGEGATAWIGLARFAVASECVAALCTRNGSLTISAS